MKVYLYLVAVVLATTQVNATNSLNDDLTVLCAISSCTDYSGSSALISSDGTPLAIKDWGPQKKNAPTLLFLHGYPHGQGLWLNQVLSPTLNSNFRVVTMDLRGSGFSGVPAQTAYEANNLGDDIQAVINTLGLKNVILVGHSLGGVMSTAYVATHGQSQLKGIVWVAAIADLPSAVIPLSTFNILVGTVSSDPTTLADSTLQFANISHYGPFPQWLTTQFYNMDMMTTLAGRLGHLSSAFANSSTVSFVNAITVPSLIIQGSNDVVIPPVNSDNLQAKLIHSAVTRVNVPGVGHLPMLEAPLTFNYLLSQFAQSLSAH